MGVGVMLNALLASIKSRASVISSANIDHSACTATSKPAMWPPQS